jgi:hypothetical protein
VYDFNYRVSREIFKERGYLEELLGYLPRSPEFARLGQQLREELAGGGRGDPGGDRAMA